MPAATPAKMAGMSDDAVAAKTGRTWAQWVKVLDKAGCRNRTHPQIVAHLRSVHGLGPWWQQMVTGGYEKLTGKRQKHEMPDGFQISANRTIAAGVAAAYQAFVDEDQRAHWLPKAKLEITTATKNKSIRFKWLTDDSRVAVMILAKGPGKCAVSLEQRKLKTAAAGEKAKAFWKARLAKLAALLE